MPTAPTLYLDCITALNPPRTGTMQIRAAQLLQVSSPPQLQPRQVGCPISSSDRTPDLRLTGTTSNCYEWHKVVSGDYCGLIESSFGISFAQFQLWNPDINAACSNLLLGDAYCVHGATAAPTGQPGNTGTTATPTASASSVTPPGPTQTGIAANCNKYTVVQSGTLIPLLGNATRVILR